MTDLTPGQAAYAVYAKHHKRPEGHVPFEDLSEFSKRFWAEVATAEAERISGELTVQFQQVLLTNRVAEQERVIAALRKWLPRYVATVDGGGTGILCSGLLAVPDALIGTFTGELDAGLLDGEKP